KNDARRPISAHPPPKSQSASVKRLPPAQGPAMTTLKNTRALSLRIPEPRYRPGETPDFSNLGIPEAGVTPRPAVDAEPKDMRQLAYGLVRVLTKDGEAVGPWKPAI